MSKQPAQIPDLEDALAAVDLADLALLRAMELLDAVSSRVALPDLAQLRRQAIDGRAACRVAGASKATQIALTLADTALENLQVLIGRLARGEQLDDLEQMRAWAQSARADLVARRAQLQAGGAR